MDILASGAADDGAIRRLVAEICAVPCPEDGLRFDLSDLTVETIRPEDEYSGKRARFRAFLGTCPHRRTARPRLRGRRSRPTRGDHLSHASGRSAPASAARLPARTRSDTGRPGRSGETRRSLSGASAGSMTCGRRKTRLMMRMDKKKRQCSVAATKPPKGQYWTAGPRVKRRHEMNCGAGRGTASLVAVSSRPLRTPSASG